MTAVLGHDGIRRRQTESGAARLGRETGIEYPEEHFGRNAGAVVLNHDPDARAGGSSAGGDNILRPNFDNSAVRHRLTSIEKDIVEHLTDLARINMGRPEIVCNTCGNAGPGAGAR